MEGIRFGRKRSGIKKEIDKKIRDWIDAVDDELVVTAIKRDAILTGGAIASMLLGEQVNDFDFYFRTKASALLVAHYYVNKFNKDNNLKTKDGVKSCTPIVKEETLQNIKGEDEDRVTIFMKSAGVASEGQEDYQYFEMTTGGELSAFSESLGEKETADKKEKYRPVFMSQNAITLSDKVQLVTRFYGEPDKIHDNYDFVHACCYYDYGAKSLVFPPEAMEALLSRTLIYRGSLYPIASIFRTKKFIERGWRITAGQQLKIMWQISELDLTDDVVLREQLVGVDMAYMHELVEALKCVDSEKINSSYVATTIDRIFD